MMEGHEERNSRAAGLRLGKIQPYPSAKSHRWLKKKARKKNKKKWANTLMGVAVGICTLCAHMHAYKHINISEVLDGIARPTCGRAKEGPTVVAAAL